MISRGSYRIVLNELVFNDEIHYGVVVEKGWSLLATLMKYRDVHTTHKASDMIKNGEMFYIVSCYEDFVRHLPKDGHQGVCPTDVIDPDTVVDYIKLGNIIALQVVIPQPRGYQCS